MGVPVSSAYRTSGSRSAPFGQTIVPSSESTRTRTNDGHASPCRNPLRRVESRESPWRGLPFHDVAVGIATTREAHGDGEHGMRLLVEQRAALIALGLLASCG